MYVVCKTHPFINVFSVLLHGGLILSPGDERFADGFGGATVVSLSATKPDRIETGLRTSGTGHSTIGSLGFGVPSSERTV